MSKYNRVVDIDSKLYEECVTVLPEQFVEYVFDSTNIHVVMSVDLFNSKYAKDMIKPSLFVTHSERTTNLGLQVLICMMIIAVFVLWALTGITVMEFMTTLIAVLSLGYGVYVHHLLVRARRKATLQLLTQLRLMAKYESRHYLDKQ